MKKRKSERKEKRKKIGNQKDWRRSKKVTCRRRKLANQASAKYQRQVEERNKPFMTVLQLMKVLRMFLSQLAWVK